jgi:hypothetical protein
MKIKQLVDKYKLTKNDFWEFKRGGQSMWIITHDACEKIAAQENIQFGAPTIYRDSNQDVAIVGDAKRGNKVLWSTGEASPKNCKAQFPWAMAEKRLKDRLILKLISAYEYGVFSESEADAFKKPNTD